MQKKMISTTTVPFEISRAKRTVLIDLYRNPEILKTLDKKNMNHRYMLMAAFDLEKLLLCQINKKTMATVITDAGAAVLEGKEPSLHSLIRLGTKG